MRAATELTLTITPPPRWRIRRDGGAAGGEDGLDIRCDLLIEKLVRGVNDGIARDKVAGVVDEDVEAAEGRLGFGHEALDHAAFGDVALEQDGPAAGLLDVSGYRRRFVPASPVVDRNMSAAAAKRASDRRADAAARARDQAGLVLKVVWEPHRVPQSVRAASTSGEQEGSAISWKAPGCSRWGVWPASSMIASASAGDAVSHLGPVLRRPGPVVSALDDQGRNADEPSRSSVREFAFERAASTAAALRGLKRDRAKAIHLGLGRSAVEEAVNDRTDCFG